LLYVACTRARDSLHLLGHVNTTSDGTEMKSPHSGSLLHRLWPALEAQYASAFDQYEIAADVADASNDETFANPILKRAATEWTMPPPPTLPQPESRVLPPIDANEKPVEFYWVGTAARHAGTIVHRWLRKLSEERNLPSVGQLLETEETTRRWASDLRVNNDAVAFVCDRVHSALSGILADPQGCWILEGEGHAEFALTGLWEGAAESIVIDRVRIDDQGIHWIIDYKTSTHEGGNLDGFLQQEEDRYRAQLQKYSTIYQNFAGAPVKTALYFPLLQRFREVALGGD
jgi:ATP-dependent helicase/nuclease subunit A